MITKKMFGKQSGHQILMISDNIDLKNTDPQW